MERIEAAAFGIFVNREDAERAVDRLTVAGFSSHDVSVLLSDRCESKEFASEQDDKGSRCSSSRGEGWEDFSGELLGLLAGIGALAIAGVGSFICCRSHHGHLGPGFGVSRGGGRPGRSTTGIGYLPSLKPNNTRAG